jgi:4-alpha-glucanotransferase
MVALMLLKVLGVKVLVLIFEAIKKELGDLPIIAEDLGVVTKEVIKLREVNNLPGMKILQFAFDSDSNNEYLPHNYNNNDYIVYTGTHDNDTTVGWYSKADEKSKDFMRKFLNVSGEDVSWDLIRFAFASAASTVIIPFQDLIGLGDDYRMNTPGVAVGNWQARYKSGMLNDDIANKLLYLCEIFNRCIDNVEEEIL